MTDTREHDPVVDALYDLMGTQNHWRGTYKQLLAVLDASFPDNAMRPPEWPRTANKLSAFRHRRSSAT